MVLLALPPLRRHFGVRILHATQSGLYQPTCRLDLNGKPECSMVQVDPYAVQNYRELRATATVAFRYLYGDCRLSLLVVRGRLKLQIKNALFRECWTRTCELQRHRRAKQERARVSAMGGAVHARRWRAPKTPTLLDVLWVDEEFCQRLRAAIETGRECCPTTVFTEPCTNRPVSNYMRPDLIRGYRAC
jgi:hypothetical protein